ncbi:winged helix-turn-helix transcriptional regulator [Frondihabitans cladoniiphilus]|uniref:HTH hxlR-type domain-containing protein n=1 Tax=Frondihabitans cladoniiphilus TaxID=715785 RepID=A0ABP8VUS3_9MICO
MTSTVLDEPIDTASAVVDACGRLPVENGQFVRQILDRVGDKWTLFVIAHLHDGPKRYTHLHELVPGISQRMLTLTLSQLRQDGILTRTAYAEVPPRVEYELTPLGLSLLDAASALIGWASTHFETIRENRIRAAAEAAELEAAAATRARRGR